MTIQPTPYPLAWPEGVPRAQRPTASQLRTPLQGAVANVKKALAHFGSDTRNPVTDVVVSSNVTLGVNSPADGGVAVWFVWRDRQRCIAVDRYRTPAENVQAIYHIIEARRVEHRHGGLVIVDQSFAGFNALPAPPASQWREVLTAVRSATPTVDEIEAAFREAAKAAHPDHGGSTEQMMRVTAAREAALREIGQ